MRTRVATATAITLLLIGPGLATQASGQSTTTEPSSAPAAAPAPKPSMWAFPHSVTGQVVSVNERAQMLTVRTSEGNTVLLKADTETASRLGSLKTGERVKVSYKNSRGEKVVTKITPA
jgi:hypothetical protein